MQLDLEAMDHGNQIHGFEPGRIHINDQVYEKSVIVTPTTIISDWPPQHITELTSQHLELLIPLKPEVVLLGTGDTQHFPENKILRPLIENKINYEVMSMAAACRTYVLLAADGRNVLAALIIR